MHDDSRALAPVRPHRLRSRGRNRTIILWRETDLVGGTVVRRVVVTLDATMNTATVLTRPQAIQVADALLAAAQ
ncbi:MAG: hypothetical protein ACRDTZ_08230 [Pseudonocardiaceae bacterium]